MIVRNPSALRPWQHVLEPVSGYLKLAEKLYSDADGYAEWNFGPEDDGVKTVEELMNHLVALYIEHPGSTINHCIHEAQLLKLDISKAKLGLNWSPNWNLEKSLRNTVDWHLSWLNGKDMRRATFDQIDEYAQL